jgi:hypothetical protein
MHKTPTLKKRRRPIRWEIRLMITSMAVAATLGFWNLFAKQMGITQTTTSKPLDPTVQNPSLAVEIDLPPVPTLIPSLERQAAVSSSAPSASSLGNNQPVQSFQAGAKILLGGARPPVQTSAPAPITTTRSSR